MRDTQEQRIAAVRGNSLQAFAGPAFRWALLNYGRIENNIRVQDAAFQALIGDYEAVVLRAQGEVESAIAGYLGAQRRVLSLTQSVEALTRAVALAEEQYRGGIADYTRVLLTQDFLSNNQLRLVATRGEVALNFVAFARLRGNLQGQAFTLFILTVAACEAAIALALFLMLYRSRQSLDVSIWQDLREPGQPATVDEEPLGAPPAEAPLPKLTPAGKEPQHREEPTHV